MIDRKPDLTARSIGIHTKVIRLIQAEWIWCLAIGLLGFIVRLPALQGEPVWDDDCLVQTNPLIKSPLLVLEVFRHYLFEGTFTSHYRPVQNLSYLFDYLIWNNNFYGFHLTSLLCHVAGAILLYLLLRRLLPGLQTAAAPAAIQTPDLSVALTAFFVALLWAVHPVHSAAVDYVSGRADSLAFLFACSAWLLFLKARSAPNGYQRWFTLAGAAGCTLLALCSRESGLIWMAIFCVYTTAFDRRIGWRPKWMTLAGCAVICVVYLGLRSLPGPPTLATESSDVTPPLLRIVLMFRSLGDYARLLVFPDNLHMERTVYDFKAYQSQTDRWSAIGQEYLSIAGMFVLAALVYLSARPGRGRRLRIFGTVWFFLAYLPVSNLVELNATVAEHWLYLPSVGFLLFVMGCVADLPRRFYRAAAAFGCIAIIALGIRSSYRSSDWLSNGVFAQRTLVSGGTTIRVMLLLAQAHAGRGDYATAERLLRRCVELSPDYPMARNNLADALAHQGKTAEAEALFAHSTQIAGKDRKSYPRTWIAALNLSHMRHKEHDDPAAIAVLEQARKEYPNTWDLLSSESEILRENNDLEGALQLVGEFAHKNWWHYRAWGGYGRLLAEKGEVEAALSALRHASWLDIHETAALNLIAQIQINQNRLEDARRTQQRAVARQPDEPRQLVLLSDILEKMGRNEDARAALAQVSRLRDVAGLKTAKN